MLLSKLAMLLSVPVPVPPSTAVSRRLSAVKRWRIGGYRWWIDQWQAYCRSIAMQAAQKEGWSLETGAVALTTKKCFVRIIRHCPQILKKGRWTFHSESTGDRRLIYHGAD
jgi:hypothetical protein